MAADMTPHIRKTVGRPDFRIGAVRRPITAETLCGAPVTWQDLTPADGRRIKLGRMDWPCCAACLSKV